MGGRASTMVANRPSRFWAWLNGKAWPRLKKTGPWLGREFWPGLLFFTGLGVISFTLALWVLGGDPLETTVSVGSTVVASPTAGSSSEAATATSTSATTTVATTTAEATTPSTTAPAGAANTTGGTTSGPTTPTTTTLAAGATAPTTPEATTTKTNAMTITTTSQTGRPSDTLYAALLGSGFALILCGAFFYRITSIKFPGGELALAAQVAKVVTKATKKTHQRDPKKIESLSRYVAARLTSEAAVTGKQPSDDYAEAVAQEGVQMLFY
jgi:hypothetical protein